MGRGSSSPLLHLHLQQSTNGVARSRKGEATRSRSPNPAKMPTTCKKETGAEGEGAGLEVPQLKYGPHNHPLSHQPPTQPSIHPPISIYPASTHVYPPSIQPSVHASTHPCMHPSIIHTTSIRLSIHPSFFLPLVHPSIHLSTTCIIHPCIHQPIYSPIHHPPTIHLSIIHSPIHPSAHSSFPSLPSFHSPSLSPFSSSFPFPFFHQSNQTSIQ